VAAANEEQITRKKTEQLRELEEEQRIAEYVRMRDLREQHFAEEKDRVAKEKEMETMRLRAAQEKAADKQSEIDELRARRYIEAAEREWRTKETSKVHRDKARREGLPSRVGAEQEGCTSEEQTAPLAAPEALK